MCSFPIFSIKPFEPPIFSPELFPLKHNAHLEHRAPAFRDGDVRRVRVRFCIHAQNLPLAAFAGVVDFKRRNVVRKKEVVAEYVQSQLDVFDVVHVVRHIDVLRADSLLVFEIVLGKTERKFRKRLVERLFGERTCRIRKPRKFDRSVRFQAEDARLLIRAEQRLPVLAGQNRVDVRLEAGVVHRERLCANLLAPCRTAHKLNLRLCEHPERIAFFAVHNTVAAERGKTFGEVVLHHQNRLRNPQPHRTVDERRRNHAPARKNQI